MTTRHALIGAGFVLTTVVYVAAQAPAQAPPPPPPAAGGGAPAAGAQAPGGGGGRGRGGPSPGQLLWTEHCSGCHGNDAAGGRAPSLFDEKWLNSVDDAKMAAAIKDGVRGTEMEGFSKALNDTQVFQLIAHIRTQTGALRPRPQFVANPAGIVIKSSKQTFRLEVLTEGLATPWALAFLPDGRLLVTERDGRLRIIQDGKLSEPVKNMPKAHVQQDGGYLDVEVHPQYAQNGWIYLSYVEDQPGYVAPPPPPPAPAPAPDAPAAPDGARAGGRGGRGGQTFVPSMTVVVRGKINKNNEWTDEQVIFRAAPELYTTSGSHYGSRFIFDKQNHLFFSIGERGSIPNAQDLKNPLGKIHRVNDDGTIPKDNPFVGTPGAVASIWSYGHRNPEGFAWDPVSNKLWESEHGPNSADEINIIEKGHNYGWGVATKAVQAGMVPTAPGMDDPIVYYTPTYAPAGIAFYTGNRYPGWRNTSLFVSGLLGQALRRLEIKGDKVVEQEILFGQFGRVRDVVQGPDGYFYIALQDPTGVPNPAGGNIALSASTPGRVVRLVPAQ